MTYVPVLGAILVSVLGNFDSFCSNWFKLVSAQPPNSQTFRQKKILLFPSSRFLVWIFLCQKVRQWLPPWRTHGGSHCLTFWQRNVQTKNPAYGRHQLSWPMRIIGPIQIFSTVFNTYVYRRVSFSAVDIIISKEEAIFGPKILMMEMTISFFVWRFGCLEAEQKPV